MYDRKISVKGLGYVGLPMAVAFGKKHKVVAFDINQKRIDELKVGEDKTYEVESKDLRGADLLLTTASEDLKQADFHIVAVPTPINSAKQPDLTSLLSASKIVGAILKKGDIVVFESTVYPGATEEDCVPVLEQHSGLACGKDFFVGYSPERINPGDKEHTFTKITKVVSGQTPEVLDIVASVYESVVDAGVYRASSIKVAEAAKVIENSQRDINIAFVNELSKIFTLMGIDTHEVLEAAGTKWNFLPFKPGLVGGHCIGVDPYYLIHKAEQLGYHPEVIPAGRRINDGMGKMIAERCIKILVQKKVDLKSITVAILGLTFKENCPDVRNTRVIDIIHELEDYGIKVVVSDPHADPEIVKQTFGFELTSLEEIQDVSLLIIAVAHNEFKIFGKKEFKRMCNNKFIFDVKNIIDADKLSKHYSVLRL